MASYDALSSCLCLAAANDSPCRVGANVEKETRLEIRTSLSEKIARKRSLFAASYVTLTFCKKPEEFSISERARAKRKISDTFTNRRTRLITDNVYVKMMTLTCEIN